MLIKMWKAGWNVLVLIILNILEPYGINTNIYSKSLNILSFLGSVCQQLQFYMQFKKIDWNQNSPKS